MTTQLQALKIGRSGTTRYLDFKSGALYEDPEGLKLFRKLEPTEVLLGEKGAPIRDGQGRVIHTSNLANIAAEHYYTKVAEQVGRPVRYEMTDPGGNPVEMTARPRSVPVTMRGRDGKLVAMDLAISDVHTNAALPNYAAGYHLADGIADIAAPSLLVPKASDVYYTWNSSNDFQRKLPTAGAAGAGVPEVNPTLGPSTYQTVLYTLGGFLPTEIQANADTPLRPLTKMMQMIVDGLRLEREYRVMTMLETTGNWNSNLVNTILSGAQWNGGPASDPLANLHQAIENSYLPVTGILWSEKCEHAFLRNPSVQKYFTFKDMVNGIPDPMKLSSTLRLPPIHTAMMKYTVGGALTYVWGNDVVLLHQPAQFPPTDQMEIATAMTFRWVGGDAPDGHVASGLLIRQYYDARRGPRGGMMVVAVHNDAEVQTSGLVGGLLVNALQ